jgi:hypothetical protein
MGATPRRARVRPLQQEAIRAVAEPLDPSVAETIRCAGRRVSAATLVAALLILGAGLRLAWLVFVGGLAPIVSESDNIAVALATTGHFADAFGPGTGATAHLAPTTPLPAAAVYALLGVRTPAAIFVLSLLALATVLTSFWLVFRVFTLAGTPLSGRLAGLGVAALLPLQFSLEMRELRSWEAGIGAAALAAMLLWALRLDPGRAISNTTLVCLGLANGAIGLVSPAAGLAGSAIIGILLLRRVRWTRWPIAVGATMAIMAAVLVPWGLRNERALGERIFLRASLGMSQALVYHDGVLTKDRAAAYNARFAQVSPLLGTAARAEYVRLGEVAYNRRLAAEARAFVAAHPAAARRIRLQNLQDFYFPPQWHFNRFGSIARGSALRVLVIGLAAAAALATLAVMLFRRRWQYYYIAAAVLVPCLPYIMTYSLLRYRYLVSTLLIFLAADGASRLWRAWRGRHSNVTATSGTSHATRPW